MTGISELLRPGASIELTVEAWGRSTETIKGVIATVRTIGADRAVVGIVEDRTGAHSFFSVALGQDGLRVISPPAVHGDAVGIARQVIAGRRLPCPETAALQTLAVAVLSHSLHPQQQEQHP